MDPALEIKKFFKGEVDGTSQDLATYSHDASLFEITPQLVVFPKDVDDIKNLVNFVREHKGLSITPRSAGTDMSGGAINDSIILEMVKYFNQIIRIEENSAITQPGVYYRDFEKATLAKNLLLPSYPASRELCTVGGMSANNSGGEKTLTYGKTEDYIQQLKVVLSDGNEYIFEPVSGQELEKKLEAKDFEGDVYRKIYKLVTQNWDLLKAAKPQVSKNSAGYYLWDVWDGKKFDLTKLFCGSQGTLGIITQIKYRLIEPKKHSTLLVIFLKDLEPLAEVTNQVLLHKPESFESYDDNTLKLAVRFLPEIIKIMKPKNLLALGWQFLPELWMTVTGGFPKLILMAEFTGDSNAEVKQKANEALAGIAKFHLQARITKSPQEAKKYWVIRRESFNLLRHHIHHERTAPFIDDLVVRPEKLPDFLPQLNQILNQYKLTYTIAGHVGDGNFHIIPLMDFADPKTREIIPELGKKVYDLVFKFQGSMTGEHNDGLVRGPYLDQMYGDKVYKLFKEVKEIFDPHDMFNPHKKVDASFAYSLDHIVKTS